MNIVVSVKFAHAKHFAEMQKWKRRDWTHVGNMKEATVRCYGEVYFKVYDVRTAGNSMTPTETRQMELVYQMMAEFEKMGRTDPIEVIWLPS